MATAKDLYPSKWLRADDVETPIIVTIARCAIEVVGQGVKAERKPVLHFTGGQRPLILNKTNFENVARILDRPDCDDWGGGKLELFAADVTFGSEIVPAVRVRAPRGKTKASPALADATTAGEELGF